MVNRDFLGPQEKSLVKQACSPEGGKALSRKHLARRPGPSTPVDVFSEGAWGRGGGQRGATGPQLKSSR